MPVPSLVEDALFAELDDTPEAVAAGFRLRFDLLGAISKKFRDIYMHIFDSVYLLLWIS